MSQVFVAAPTQPQPAPQLPLRRQPAHRISDAAEALQVARQLAAGLAADASLRDQQRRLPLAELETISDSGLLAITVPKRFGGAQVDSPTLAQVTAILAEADASIGQIPQNHFYLLEALYTNGSEDQQARYYAHVLAGDRFGNALAELGTPTSLDIRTRASAQPDGSYLIDGHKAYSSGALFAHWIAVQALDPQQRPVLAIVPRASVGLTLLDDWRGIGQRTTGSGSSRFEQVQVPATDVIPHYLGFEHPSTIGPLGQLLHAAIDLGLARAALGDTLGFVRNHSRPWKDSGVATASDDPYVVARVGEIQTRISAADALLERAGGYVDHARDDANERSVAEASVAVAEAKIATTLIALHASQTLIELAGTQSSLQDHNLDRHWRNARTHTLHDPVRWKYQLIGNYLLNGVAPPRHGSV